MDITRGSLDDISRPASSERSRAGSRVSTVLLPDTGRVCQPSSTSLEVLSDDGSNSKQDNNNSYENLMSPDESPLSKTDLSDEENEDSDLQNAIKKMEVLDKILASRIAYEKEVKRKGKELHQTLWQDLLQIKPNSPSGCTDEAENTRRFLEPFTSSTHGSIEDVDFVPVFGTQMPDKEYERHSMQVEGGEKDVKNTATDSSAEGPKEREGSSECSQSGLPRDKKKQDFLKKNIELVSGAGDSVQMTQQEKDRLKELLKDIEDEEDNAGKSVCEVLEAGWDSDRDRLPGEEVLKDIREKRAQERRLKEIQLQLELLGRDQEMTCDTPKLLEEQLRTLLVECEISQSWCHGLGTGDTSPRDNLDTGSLPSSTPPLSDSVLSELLKDAYTTSFSLLDKGTTMYSS
ncbi:fibrous sheath-interacting protein 1 isoform X6 [Esox lucius]|uniref:Fibrous sheath-interacting protein 1 n=1 Tax=Esox lucius TaxID=8010 RepID=A0A6Q2YDC4_ESOLU|nr:fibrous sheath-interacting protein 1 isoform X6 [Esox lucius]